MKTYTLATDAGDMSYTDTKRYLWMASLAYALMPFLGIGAHAVLVIKPGCFAALCCLCDWTDSGLVAGEDENNPPEEIVPLLEEDPYYRLLPMLTVPLHFASLIGAAYWAVRSHCPGGVYSCWRSQRESPTAWELTPVMSWATKRLNWSATWQRLY